MTVLSFRAAALAACAAALLAPVALAQTRTAPHTATRAPAPQADAPQVSEGPAIANLCVWRPQEVAANSKMGQAMVTRLNQIGAQIKAELQPELDGVNAEAKRLQALTTQPDDATIKAFNDRKNGYVQKAQMREQQMKATQAVQFDTIRKDMTPIIRELYQQHRCSLLLDYDSGAVTQVNPEMDLSREVQAALDQQHTTLTFELMTPDQVAALMAQAQQQPQR